MDKIKFGKHVDLAYEIFTVDDGGEAASVFKFTDKHPDSFVYGLDKGMIDGFANAINGLAEGDSFDFTLEPKDAFGEKNPDMVQVLGQETLDDLAKEQIPLGRLGKAEEIAETVLYLARAGYTTGQVITVDGGFII